MSSRGWIQRIWGRIVGREAPNRTWQVADHVVPPSDEGSAHDPWDGVAPTVPAIADVSQVTDPAEAEAIEHSRESPHLPLVASGAPVRGVFSLEPQGDHRTSPAISEPHITVAPATQVETIPVSDDSERAWRSGAVPDEFLDWDDSEARSELRATSVGSAGPAASELDDAFELPEPESFLPQEAESAGREKAAAKAAAIVQHVYCRTQTEQSACLDWLTELFSAQRHPATYQALHDLAEGGLDWEMLRAIVALREHWAEAPDWWCMRRYDRLRAAYVVVRPVNGANLLSWRLAKRICERRAHYPPEMMIDDAWFREWVALEPGTPGFDQFVQYVGLRVRELEAEPLH